MLRKTSFLIVALIAVASTGHSQTGGSKKTDPGEAEMTFANGSVVRMALLPGEIEINTEFGKLMVPVRQIRRIDFGLHLPEGADKKIAAAIKQMASPQYKEREEAVRELVTFGAFAYPSLLQAARSGDPEAAKRAQDAIAKIKAKVPAKDLQLSEDDKIVTPRFTIVGRIVNPAIKAKSEYFGDVEHALAKLRNVRVLVETRDTELAIDAAKYALPNQWLDTGILVDSNGSLGVIASGEVELRPTTPGTYISGPRGYTRAGFGAAAGGFPAGGKKKGVAAGDGPARMYPGALLGRIGPNGDTFVIGDRYEGAPEREGKLYLQIMPSPYEPNSVGTYQVKVMVRD